MQEGRKRWAGESPIGMLPQLFPALVALVNRVEECHGVGNMDEDGQPKLPGCLPDGPQADVIHINKLVCVVFDQQSQTLPDFQPLCPARFLRPEPAGSPFWEGIAFFLPLRPIHTAKDLEAFGSRLLEMLQMGAKQRLTPASVQVNVADDTCLVEPVEQLCQRALVPATAKGLAQVIVSVDGREARFFHKGGFSDKLGVWP